MGFPILRIMKVRAVGLPKEFRGFPVRQERASHRPTFAGGSRMKRAHSLRFEALEGERAPIRGPRRRSSGQGSRRARDRQRPARARRHAHRQQSRAHTDTNMDGGYTTSGRSAGSSAAWARSTVSGTRARTPSGITRGPTRSRSAARKAASRSGSATRHPAPPTRMVALSTTSTPSTSSPARAPTPGSTESGSIDLNENRAHAGRQPDAEQLTLVRETPGAWPRSGPSCGVLPRPVFVRMGPARPSLNLCSQRLATQRHSRFPKCSFLISVPRR